MIFVLADENKKTRYGFAFFDLVALPLSNILLAAIIYELIVKEHTSIIKSSFDSSETGQTSNNMQEVQTVERSDSSSLIGMLRYSGQISTCDEAMLKLYYSKSLIDQRN